MAYAQRRNRQLTQVGPGILMGEVLRRYWHPIAGIGELERHPVKSVRLMGEDLVLYKDLSGQYGLVDRQCAHRRADLSYGFVEDHGIAMLRRCLLENVDAVKAEHDPKGVMRDARSNQRVFLPSDSPDFFQTGLPLADYQRHPKWARLLNPSSSTPGDPSGCSTPMLRPPA